eukprot:CAMPEP_0171117328 /NCGR_PEP_ID=MMETSP0766_2-20121228/92222_1 /TAXON_ID=439317 /ORGANISM="Gambierdiscus australes, Strain CAWD 149" /LENGTH=109 /DNA_ID=CAMNT_0011579829 /DNA_START=158 /DNA_END=483 /DNA_ORIENTATION=+
MRTCPAQSFSEREAVQNTKVATPQFTKSPSMRKMNREAEVSHCRVPPQPSPRPATRVGADMKVDFHAGIGETRRWSLNALEVLSKRMLYYFGILSRWWHFGVLCAFQPT